MQKKLFIALSLLSFVGISRSAAEKTSTFEILARSEREQRAFQRAFKGEQHIPGQRNDPNNRRTFQEYEQQKKDINATTENLIQKAAMQAAAMQAAAMQNDEEVTVPSIVD